MSKLGDVVSKLVQLKCVTDGTWRWSHQLPETMGVWGRSSQPLGDFLSVSGKKNGYFNASWITFHMFSEPFKRTKFLRFESQLNKSLPLLQVKSKIRLKSCILWLNFVTWPGWENQGTLLSATFLALNHSLEDLLLKIFVLS